MEKDLMTIRQMCDAFEVTPRTLRFYEAKELIAPQRVGQKRLYDRRDRARLTLILRGKRFGFSLENIRQLLDMYDLSDKNLPQMERTYELATERLKELERQSLELNQTIDELKQNIEWGAQAIAKAKANGQK